MVIVKISQGMANALYEFASGYALAKRLNQEMVLDISECVVSNVCGWGFPLDYFNIPQVKKLVYGVQDITHTSHQDINSIPKHLREDSTILVEHEADIVGGGVWYKSLKDIDKMNLRDNIYLCGYFFSREKYYDDYWEEIKRLFTLSEKSVEVLQFEQLIEGKVSVGIHMRRGDMLLAEWATRMNDNYYLAAMEICRERFGNCIFCVFSDDIDYAKQLIGKDKSVYYVHYLGYDNAALDEFMCLSMCTHRILSNSSTFSRLADELNGADERKTFFQGVISSEKSGIFRKILNVVKKYLKKYKKGNNGSVLIDYDQIEKYAKKYKNDNVDNIKDYEQKQEAVLCTSVTCDNCYEINEKIAGLSLNVYDRSDEAKGKMLLQKFYCYCFMKKFDMALQLAFVLYDSAHKEDAFISKYIEMLSALQYKEEALVEALGYNSETLIDGVVHGDRNLLLLKNALESERKHFVIVPYAKMVSADRILSFGEIGVILSHLGHDVTLVVEPSDTVDVEQINKEARLRNRQGVYLPCDVLLYKKVIDEGIADLYASFADEDVVVIARRPEMFVDKEYCNNKKLHYVYWDFSAMNEPEAPLAKEKLSPGDELKMINSADCIMTTKWNDDSRYVVWEERKCEYEFIEDRWDFSKEHRLNIQYIYAVAKMMERIK